MTATLPTDMPSTGPGQSVRKSVDREELSQRLFGSAAKKSYDPTELSRWQLRRHRTGVAAVAAIVAHNRANTHYGD
jgi:hypothetical protein